MEDEVILEVEDHDLAGIRRQLSPQGARTAHAAETATHDHDPLHIPPPQNGMDGTQSSP
jgi:hypothetical protein